MSGPASFTPSDAIDPAKERDWPAQLGMLDWDSTSIVFTKRSLLEFLKYAGVTVDPNFTNIQKLPRYVKFGKLSGDIGVEQGAADATVALPSAPTAVSDFKPSRRVRDVPGGSHTNIFQQAGDDDALAAAPPKPAAAIIASVTEAEPESEAAAEPASQQRNKKATSSVASLWDAPDDAQAFKPTRRVREMPGGKDSISGLF